MMENIVTAMSLILNGFLICLLLVRSKGVFHKKTLIELLVMAEKELEDIDQLFRIVKILNALNINKIDNITWRLFTNRITHLSSLRKKNTEKES